jgi:hypothetical protein
MGEFEEGTRQRTEWDRRAIDKRHCDSSKCYLYVAEEMAHMSQVEKGRKEKMRNLKSCERGGNKTRAGGNTSAACSCPFGSLYI